MTKVSATAFWLSLTLVVSLGLYHTSYHVENLGRELKSLNRKIQSEQRAIHILKAEWTYLANPARIEKAARKHLDLKPAAPEQVTDMRRLANLLPATLAQKKTAQAAPVSRVAQRTIRPAAHTPKVATGEQSRLNRRIVFTPVRVTKNGERPTLLQWGAAQSLTLADTRVAP